jgi:hypothetical protein
MYYPFFKLAKRFQSIVYNNKERDAFLVVRDDGTIMEFVPSPSGLYYYDFNTSMKRQIKYQTSMVVNSVEELQRNYIEEARRLYVIMGRPSKADFHGML